MKKIILLTLLSVSLSFAAEFKVVFNLTSGDDKTVASKLIKNIEILKQHYKEEGHTLTTAVVISGNSYKYFRNDTTTNLDAKLKSLAKNGTEFQVCSVGLKKRNIKKSSLDEFVVPAFNRTAALINYQNAGYAYVEVE